MDKSPLIRNAVRKVLKVVELQNLELFKSSINALIQNLEKNHEVHSDSLLCSALSNLLYAWKCQTWYFYECFNGFHKLFF